MSNPQFEVAPFDFKVRRYPKLLARVLRGARVQPPDWKANEADALLEASQKKRVILALFTGPTFCTPCKALEMEVLSTALFSSWSHNRVVLLKVEFVKGVYVEASSKLALKYDVWGLPTALALDPQGKEIGRLEGYSLGKGAKNWLISFESAAKLNSSLLP